MTANTKAFYLRSLLHLVEMGVYCAQKTALRVWDILQATLNSRPAVDASSHNTTASHVVNTCDNNLICSDEHLIHLIQS